MLCRSIRNYSRLLQGIHFKNQFCFSRLEKEDQFASAHMRNKKNMNVRIDERMIMEKMEQLKQQKNKANSQNPPFNPDLMPKITPTLNKKIRQFRKETNTESLLAFSDETVQDKPFPLAVGQYSEEYIRINNLQYPTSLILSLKQLLIWQVQTQVQLQADHFLILKYLTPKPDYVILGVPQPQKLSQSLIHHLQTLHQNIEIMQTFQGIGQFNLSSADEINVLAFLLVK